MNTIIDSATRKLRFGLDRDKQRLGYLNLWNIEKSSDFAYQDSFADYLFPVNNITFNKSMKIPACILIFLLGFLTVQPLFSTVGKPSKTMKGCSESKPECEEGKESEQEEKGCENNRCNPFMSCTTGNFYVVENFFTNNFLFAIERIKPFLTDDNRLLTQLSECWHPPELI